MCSTKVLVSAEQSVLIVESNLITITLPFNRKLNVCVMVSMSILRMVTTFVGSQG